MCPGNFSETRALTTPIPESSPQELHPRVLGIDYGEARIGIAISDELGFLAHPLETIHCRKTHPLKRIAAIVKEKGVAKLVLGLPLRRDGTEGPAAERVRAFSDRLRSELPDIPQLFVDESFSTIEAQKHLHEAGKNTKRSKPVIDQAAAVVILQSYLDRHADTEPA